MTSRHRNNGIRKVCDCGRGKWSKCPHDWHFNFTWRGQVHRFSLDRHLGRQLTGKSEAQREANTLRTAIQEGRFGAGAPQLAALTLRQLVAQYVEREMNVKRPGAYDRDGAAIDVALRTSLPRTAGGELPLGDWPVIDITTDTIERFREARTRKQAVTREGERGIRTVGGAVAANRHLAFLRAVFNWAIRVGYTERTPFKRGTETVVQLAREQRRRRRLEAGEQERLVAACAPHLRLLIEAALETGCRLGELLSLQWSQVQVAPRPHLLLPAQKTKTKSERHVPMSTRLRAVLEMRRTDPNGASWPPIAYVFGNHVGQRIGRIQAAWRAACRRAGITDLHFHDLRREAGSRWLDGGVPLQVVRDWLGHANVSQTSTYLATTTESEYEALRRFEAFQQSSVAFPCITHTDNAPRAGTISTEVEQETTENIEGMSSGDDFRLPENHGVGGSIPSLATSLRQHLK